MASYRIRRVVCEGYDRVGSELEEAINKEVEGHERLVSCVLEPTHHGGVLHEVPESTLGDSAYDDVWNRPVGPAFLLVIEAD